MARNNKDDDGDFIRMQQEAIKRVRDMQARARITLENDGAVFGDVPPPPPPKPPRPSYEPKPSRPEVRSVWNAPMANFSAQPPSSHGQGDFPGGAQSYREAPPPEEQGPHGPPGPVRATQLPLPQKLALALDNEQILLMLLIYMLYRDGSDKFLMLALVYILIF
jgi:hypothetical protein